MSNNRSHQETMLGRYAGFLTRLIAWITDVLIVGLIVALVFMIGRFVLDTIRFNQLLGIDDTARIIVNVIAGSISLLFVVFYNIIFWMLAGQTPGKRMMGVRVVRTNGDRVNLGTAVKRQIGLLLSAILFLGYLWVLVDNRRQGFHDKIADTFVVYAWPETQPLEGKPVRERIRKLQGG